MVSMKDIARECGCSVATVSKAPMTSADPVADMGTAGGAAAVKLGPPKFGHAVHIVNSLLRAESELPGAKPFDFSGFVKF